MYKSLTSSAFLFEFFFHFSLFLSHLQTTLAFSSESLDRDRNEREYSGSLRRASLSKARSANAKIRMNHET